MNELGKELIEQSPVLGFAVIIVILFLAFLWKMVVMQKEERATESAARAAERKEWTKTLSELTESGIESSKQQIHASVEQAQTNRDLCKEIAHLGKLLEQKL